MPDPPSSSPDTRARARGLREQLTPAEARLWTHLSGSKLGGWKFRRQFPFGRYILDFYCPRARLAVELDGESHQAPATREKDDRRDAFLRDHGIRILRFENRVVFEATAWVLQQIQNGLEDQATKIPPARRPGR